MSLLDDLVARCEAAKLAPAPWRSESDEDGWWRIVSESWGVQAYTEADGEQAQVCAEWIAHARTDLPALAADFRVVAEALRAAIKSFKAERPGYWIETDAVAVVDRWLGEGT